MYKRDMFPSILRAEQLIRPSRKYTQDEGSLNSDPGRSAVVSQCSWIPDHSFKSYPAWIRGKLSDDEFMDVMY